MQDNSTRTAMDEREQRQFIRFLANEVKLYFREVLAYQLVLDLLKDSGIPGIDDLMEMARNSPIVQAGFEKQFEHFDELLPPSDEELSEEALRDLLQHWKPMGEPN